MVPVGFAMTIAIIITNTNTKWGMVRCYSTG